MSNRLEIHKTETSLYTFFISLQKEYLVAKFRFLSYSSDRNKSYWLKTMNYKKRRIEDLSLRNRWESLLTSPTILDKIFNLVFEEYKYPHFTYKSPSEKLELEELDFYSFYQKGHLIDVRLDFSLAIEKGQILSSTFQNKTITTSLNKKNIVCSTDMVNRSNIKQFLYDN